MQLRKLVRVTEVAEEEVMTSPGQGGQEEGHSGQRGQQHIQRHGHIKLQVSLAAVNIQASLKHEFQIMV